MWIGLFFADQTTFQYKIFQIKIQQKKKIGKFRCLQRADA